MSADRIWPLQDSRLRVLVTGAAGMVGHPVAIALQACGHSVLALDPLRPPMDCGTWVQDRLEHLEPTVELLKQLRVDAAIHAGGISGPMIAPDDPYRVFQTNVVGSMNLFEAARRVGIGRIVYCSSGAAYGDTEDDPVPESAPLRPLEMYGATKAMVDTVIPVYRQRHGVDIVSLRLSHVYGPGRRTDCVIRTMVSDALAGRPTQLVWGRGYSRPYCHVDDAVTGVLGALLAPGPREAHYNIGADAVVGIERIAQIIRANVPEAAITLGEGPPAGATRRNLPSIAAATRDFGYRPTIDIDSGIQRYVAWARARGGVD